VPAQCRSPARALRRAALDAQLVRNTRHIAAFGTTSTREGGKKP
jgi:hypothetical protein